VQSPVYSPVQTPDIYKLKLKDIDINKNNNIAREDEDSFDPDMVEAKYAAMMERVKGKAL
jgi:hypothetical protein